MAIGVGSEVCIDVSTSGKPTVIGVVVADAGGGTAWDVLWESGVVQSAIPTGALLELDEAASSLRQCIADGAGVQPTGDAIGMEVAQTVGGSSVVRTQQGYQYLAASVKYLDTK